MFGGCAEQSSSTSRTTAAANEPGTKTRSQEELKKTGRSETGEALKQTDPSVQTTGNR